jgi:hypothetical protein
MADDEADAVIAEDEAEGYRARARVLLSPGPDRADFVRLLDALNDILAEEEEVGGAEAAADLASVLEIYGK